MQYVFVYAHNNCCTQRANRRAITRWNCSKVYTSWVCCADKFRTGNNQTETRRRPNILKLTWYPKANLVRNLPASAIWLRFKGISLHPTSSWRSLQSKPPRTPLVIAPGNLPWLNTPRLTILRLMLTIIFRVRRQKTTNQIPVFAMKACSRYGSEDRLDREVFCARRYKRQQLCR